MSPLLWTIEQWEIPNSKWPVGGSSSIFSFKTTKGLIPVSLLFCEVFASQVLKYLLQFSVILWKSGLLISLSCPRYYVILEISVVSQRTQVYSHCAMVGWSAEHATTFWDRWDMDTVMHYPVSQQRHDLLENQRDENFVKTPMRSIGRPSRANMTLLTPPQSPSSIRKKCAICNSVVDTKAGHTVLNARNWKL